MTVVAANLLRGALFLLLGFAQVLFAEGMHPARETDAGSASLAAPARRVVTLTPALTELVFAVGAGDKLVAVSAFSDFPDAARKLPIVADANGISLESLLALKPDLVLAWNAGTRPADIKRLRALGLNVSVVDIAKMDDVARAMRSIGSWLGRAAAAETAAREFESKLSVLRLSHTGKPKVKTFFQISSNPLMTINSDHVISEMIDLCGGANVFGDALGLVIEPSREALLARAPEAILYGQTAPDQRGVTPKIYQSLSAARAGRIYGVTADHALRPGPRLIHAATEVCEALDQSRASLRAGQNRF